MSRPIKAIIDLAAMSHNIQLIKNQCPDAKLFGALKANAYGHGLLRVIPAVSALDATAVLDLAEAELLRNNGWRKPILMLEGAFEPRDLELFSQLNLWHVIHCHEQIDWLAAHKSKNPHTVFLKLNSGMNRLGFKGASFQTAWHRVNGLTQVEQVVVMSHYSDAESLEKMQAQKTKIDLQTEKMGAVEKSLENSAGIFNNSHADHDDWVRCGIAQYGSSPLFPKTSAAALGLKPVMSLLSKIIAVQELEVGDTVGYGSTFTATENMRIGIVACGYADGYPRHAATGTPVLVAGKKSRTIGRVSMDMLAVEMLAESKIGDEVVLWGNSELHDQQLLPIDEVAQHAQTISYELMCALAQRVPVTIKT